MKDNDESPGSVEVGGDGRPVVGPRARESNWPLHDLPGCAAIEEQAQPLMTIPGVGITVAMGLLAAIGGICRFPSPGQLASYFGLVPRVSQSAGRCHHGRITKAGPGYGRSASAARWAEAVLPATLCRRVPLATTALRLRRMRLAKARWQR
jgi:transposase